LFQNYKASYAACHGTYPSDQRPYELAILSDNDAGASSYAQSERNEASSATHSAQTTGERCFALPTVRQAEGVMQEEGSRMANSLDDEVGGIVESMDEQYSGQE